MCYGYAIYCVDTGTLHMNILQTNTKIDKKMHLPDTNELLLYLKNHFVNCKLKLISEFHC